MHRKNSMRIWAALLCAAVTLAAAPLAPAPVEALLEKFPAKSLREGDVLCARLIEAGPGGIAAVCAQLVPPGTGDDTKARYALTSLVKYATRDGADREQKAVSASLQKGLADASDKEVRGYLIRQLQVVGRDECVPALAEYLGDARLCEPATQALLAIRTDAARDAFVQALPAATDETRVTLIDAVGDLQAKAAAREVGKHASSADRETRLAALWALANIGEPSAADALKQATKSESLYEKSKATSYYLLFAQRQVELDRGAGGAAICRELLQARTARGDMHVRSAALSTLVAAVGANALPELLAAASSKELPLRAAALKLAQSAPGSAVTREFAQTIPSVDPAARRDIIEMLGRRGDKAALSALPPALKDENKDVRLATIEAAGRLGGPATLGQVLAALEADQQDEIKTAKDALARIPGQESLDVARSALTSAANPAVKVAMIEVLGSRRDQGSAAAVFELAQGGDAGVRAAALKALGNVAQPADLPRLIDLMLQAQDNRERETARKAVVSLAQEIEDSERRAAPLVAAMRSAQGAGYGELLKALSGVGGAAALKTVTAETGNNDREVKNAAVRALADWPTDDAVPALLAVMKGQSELTHRVLATQGCVRLTKDSGKRPKEKIAIYRDVLAAASRPDEKKLALSGLAEIRTLEALQVVAPLLDDDALKNDAASAVARIAVPEKRNQKGLTGAGVRSALVKAAALTKDKQRKGEIEKYLKSLPPETSAGNSAGTSAAPAAKQDADAPVLTSKPVPPPEGGHNVPPKGFVALFNGKDLTGWKGLLFGPNDNPVKRAKLDADALAKAQTQADENMRQHWSVKDGILLFDGKGHSLATAKDYEDFEMFVDWKIIPRGDSGIYLRGTPQVQIWDPNQHKIGSGGLYNNKKKENPSKPLVTADNPIGEWNRFKIKMIGERVTVHLNDQLVVDNVVLENYWDRTQPIFPKEQIELQCHGNPVEFRNVFIREIPRDAKGTADTKADAAAGDEEGFVSIFNGEDLTGWIGATQGYDVVDGAIVCGKGGNLYTEKPYGDFHLKLDIRLTPGGNNGLGIRTPPKGDAAYVGMELQVLDNKHQRYAKLNPMQYHGSVYGIVAAKRYIEKDGQQVDVQKPTGEWNQQEVIAKGHHIKVILNGEVIVDRDVSTVPAEEYMGKKKHAGALNLTGHIGFLGHGSKEAFRNLRIKELK